MSKKKSTKNKGQENLIPGPKFDQGKRAERLALAEGIMLDTLSNLSAEAKIATRLKLSRRSARRYMKAVKKMWAIRRANEDHESKRQEILDRFKRIYARAMAEGDLKTATLALNRLGEYEGAKPSERHEVSVTHSVPQLPTYDLSKLTLEESKAFRAMLAKATDENPAPIDVKAIDVTSDETIDDE